MTAAPVIIDPTKFGSMQGRVAVVTGGSSGIGYATVKLLASLEAKVLVADLIRPPDADVAFQKTDVTSYEDQLALFKKCKKLFGTYPDIVCANAGITEMGNIFDNLDIEKAPNTVVIDINLIGAMYTARLGIWGLEQEKKAGNVIFTASIAGYIGHETIPLYVASKAAIVGLTRSLSHRSEAKKLPISVSLVAPGVTLTPILYAGASAEMMENVLARIKAAGAATNDPEHVAHAIVDLVQQGFDSNGMGYFVQGGKVVDIEGTYKSSQRARFGGEFEDGLQHLLG